LVSHVRENRTYGSKRKLETEHPIMVTAVKRPAEKRVESGCGDLTLAMAQRQPPSLHPASCDPALLGDVDVLAGWPTFQGQQRSNAAAE
jgi:hypothetical protein